MAEIANASIFYEMQDLSLMQKISAQNRICKQRYLIKFLSNTLKNSELYFWCIFGLRL